MNLGLGKYLALFFASCFLALPFYTVIETNAALQDNQSFYIDQAGTTERRVDSRFVYTQQFASKYVELSQQKVNFEHQSQYPEAANHPFRQYICECVAVVYKNYEDTLITSFNYLLIRELSFKLTSILISNLKQIYTVESDSQISLS